MKMVAVLAAILTTAFSPPALSAEFFHFIVGAPLKAVIEYDEATARQKFDNPETFSVAIPEQPGKPAWGMQESFDLRKAGWRLRVAYSFWSYANFKQFVDRDRIRSVATAIVYDNEPGTYNADGSFKGTARVEVGNNGLTNPDQSARYYTIQFSKLAKSLGYTMVAAPSCRSVQRPVTVSGVTTFPIDWMNDEHIDRCIKYLAAIAPYVDYMIPQFQTLANVERYGTTRFRDITLRARAAVKLANPSIKFGMAFTASRDYITNKEIVDSYRSVMGLVEGYWGTIIYDTPWHLKKGAIATGVLP